MDIEKQYMNQVATLQTLIEMGYQYLPHLRLSKQNLAHILLEDVLEKQLRSLNRFSKYEIGAENIAKAIDKLKKVAGDRGVYGNQALCEFIASNHPVTSISEKRRRCDLVYVDWLDSQNNTYHCAVDYLGESKPEYIRSDIVLFINGIPLAILECETRKEEIEKSNLRMKFSDPGFTVCEGITEYLAVIAFHNRELKNANVIREIDAYLINKMSVSLDIFAINKMSAILLKKQKSPYELFNEMNLVGCFERKKRFSQNYKKVVFSYYKKEILASLGKRYPNFCGVKKPRSKRGY